MNDFPSNQPPNSTQNKNKNTKELSINQKTQKNKKNYQKTKTDKRESYTGSYLGFTLFAQRSDKSEKKTESESFRGEVLRPENNQLGDSIFEANGKSIEDVISQLKKLIDSKEKSAAMTDEKSIGNLVTKNNIKTTSEEYRKNPPISLEENSLEENNNMGGTVEGTTIVAQGKTNNTSEPKQIVEKDYNSANEQDKIIIQLLNSLSKNHARLINDVNSINLRLDKINSSIDSIKDEFLPQTQNGFLVRINRAIKSNIEELLKGHNEEQQNRENLLKNIFAKINTAAQADHVNEHLANLQTQSKNLYSWLDAKIDLQDAQKILNLRSEIERFVRDDLIRSISKIIMPVVDILKDQAQDRDAKLVAVVNNLEQRCKQAGLKSSDLF